MLPLLSEIKQKADALIFDIDGTLLDSMTVWNQADIVFLNLRGFEVTPDYTDYVKSARIEDAAVYTKERFGLPDTPESIMNEWNAFVDHAYAYEVPLKDGAYEYLAAARAAGFKTACATALTPRNIRSAFTRLGILGMFDSIVTLSGLPGFPDKSRPDIFLHTASLLSSLPSRTIVFEDVPAALSGASKGGFMTCAVKDPVGAGSERSWVSMTEDSDYFFTSWRELIED